MKRSAWKWAGMLAAAVLAGSAPAQGPGCLPPQGPPCPAGPGAVAPLFPRTDTAPRSEDGTQQPREPGEALTNQDVAADNANQGAASDDLFGGVSQSRSGMAPTTVISAGTGIASATATAGGTTTGFALVGASQSPLILPGLFTAAQAENAIPVDRAYVSYGYFNRFRSVQTTPLTTTPFFRTTPSNFDLNTVIFGLEKTFFNGRASAYVRVPFLDATGNNTGASIDGLGDVSAGIKAALFVDAKSGSTLTTGFTVSAPTARDQTFFFNQNTSGGLLTAPAGTTRVNPTFLQPYVSNIFIRDRFFTQQYVGAIIPTDDRIATLINGDLVTGYQVYRGCSSSLLNSVTATLGAQALIPVNHQGAQTPAFGAGLAGVTPGVIPSFSDGGRVVAFSGQGVQNAQRTQIGGFGFPDQLFLSSGLQYGLGKRALLSTSFVVPVVGPRAYSYGSTVGLNFFY